MADIIKDVLNLDMKTAVVKAAADSTVSLMESSDEVGELSESTESMDTDNEAEVNDVKGHIRALIMDQVRVLNTCENNERRLGALQQLRDQLHNPRFNIFDSDIIMDVLSPLVDSLAPEFSFGIQSEAVLALTHFAMGNTIQKRALLDAGAVPPLIVLMLSNSDLVSEHAIWALGKIMDDSSSIRDFCVEMGIIPQFFTLLTEAMTIWQARNIAWALGKLCNNLATQSLPFHVIKMLVEKLMRLLFLDDHYVTQNSLWAIAYLTDGDIRAIEAILSVGLINELMPVLASPEFSNQAAVMYALTNIIKGPIEHKEFIMERNPLSYFPQLLSGPCPGICQHIMLFLCNFITEENNTYCNDALHISLMPHIIDHLEKDNYENQKQAVKVVYNIIIGGNEVYCIRFTEQRVLAALKTLLYSIDDNVVETVLKCIVNLLSMFQHSEVPIVNSVFQVGTLNALDTLQDHQNFDIYYLCYQIIDRFYSYETSL